MRDRKQVQTLALLVLIIALAGIIAAMLGVPSLTWPCIAAAVTLTLWTLLKGTKTTPTTETPPATTAPARPTPPPPAADHAPQGRFVTSRCVAGPGGRWQPATIRRANEDGTFTVELDVKAMLLLPHWHGVTREEISFDDPHLWPAVFAAISADGQTLSPAEAAAALARLGYTTDGEAFAAAWPAACAAALDPDPPATTPPPLNQAQAYRAFLALGVSALAAHRGLIAPPPAKIAYHKMYWNQTRMGGRAPADVSRPITADDALEALGLAAADEDPAATAFFTGLERTHALTIPPAVKQLLSRHGAPAAIKAVHPNNPELVPFTPADWAPHPPRKDAPANATALTFLLPHQGDFAWAIEFTPGDNDAAVHLVAQPPDDPDGQQPARFIPTAPTLAFFLWDLAQTGLAWHEELKPNDRPRTRRTDVGLAIDA